MSLAGRDDIEGMLLEGRAGEALSLLTDDSSETRLLRARCLRHLGKLCAAEDALRGLGGSGEFPEAFRVSLVAEAEMLLVSRGENPLQSLRRLKRLLSRVGEPDGKELRYAISQANHAAARLLIIAHGWSLLPLRRLAEVEEHISAVLRITPPFSSQHLVQEATLDLVDSLLRRGGECIERGTQILGEHISSQRSGSRPLAVAEALLRWGQMAAKMIQLPASPLPPAAEALQEAKSLFEAYAAPRVAECLLAEAQLSPSTASLGLLERAIALFEERGSITGSLEARLLLVQLLHAHGETEGASSHIIAAQELATEMGSSLASAVVAHGTALLQVNRGEIEEARAVLDDLVGLCDDPMISAVVGLGIAQLLAGLPGTSERGMTLLIKLERSYKRVGDSKKLCLTRSAQAFTAMRCDSWATALKLWRKVRREYLRGGDIIALAETDTHIAQCEYMGAYTETPGRVSAATLRQTRRRLARVVKTLTESAVPGAQAALAATMQIEGQLLVAEEQFSDALRVLAQARALYSELELVVQQAFTDSLIALVLRELSRRGQRDLAPEAEFHFREALRTFKRAGMRDAVQQVRALQRKSNTSSTPAGMSVH